ncbi:MAG: hypothetical protein LLG40_15720 [Deltaproteobacteria bacterium]|nr:hypothetical protein [Deltaproteobacteria bacterium]
MYELKTNTAARIAVGPLVDPTDGKTAETALTVTDLSVQLYQIKNDGSAVVRTQFAPTASGGNNDMALVTSSTDGMYDLELTAAQLNFLGNGRICFYDVDGFLVHWIDIQVVSAAFFDWKYGTTAPEIDLKKILGTSLTETSAGYLAAAFKKLFDIETPVLTAASVNQTGDAYAIVNNATYGLSALKTLLEAIAGYIDEEVAAIKAKTDNLPADPADQSAVEAAITAAIAAIEAAIPTADAIHDEVVEGSLTFRQIIRILLAFAAGKSTGGGTATITFRDVADAKARITATADGDGNRSAITLDGA